VSRHDRAKRSAPRSRRAATAAIRERGVAIRVATPLGRIGTPDDIAAIVAFLPSSDSGWITGRTILAAGGLN
jgi:3-oxoacyl-[acyl-carrier protein] reductase